MEKFLVGINWPKVVGGQGLRDMAPIEQKSAGVTYSNDLDLGLRDGQVIVPGGLVNTSGIDDLLRSYVANSRSQSDFSKLPIPYRAVATDMVSGEMVVLGSGDLPTAMRASMAIPGFFAPVRLDNYILNDGGMVRNLPVDVARDLCADVVIVVNLVTEPTTPDKLQTATQLAGRAMDVMLEANVRLQLQTLKPGDVLINVHMGDIGTADFERVPETIPLGEKAARAAAGELAKYSVPPEQYAAWRQHVTTGQEIDARVAGVQIKGLEWMNPAYLETRTDIKPGDQVDNQRISEQAREMSALKDLESVGYQLTGDPKNPTLEWLPKEKSWGPNFMQFDLGLYATTSNDSGFVLYMKTDRRWLNSLGLQWRNEIQLGANNILATSLYQPLNVAQTFFVEPKVFFTRAYENVYLDQERIANYRFDDLGGTLDLGVNFGTRAQLRLGYLYTDRDVTVDTGSPELGEVHAVDAGIVSQAIYDTRDTAFNPTRGIVGAIEYMRSDTSLGADRDWEQAGGRARHRGAGAGRHRLADGGRRHGPQFGPAGGPRFRHRRPGQLPGPALEFSAGTGVLDGEWQLPLEAEGHPVHPRPGAVCRDAAGNRRNRPVERFERAAAHLRGLRIHRGPHHGGTAHHRPGRNLAEHLDFVDSGRPPRGPGNDPGEGHFPLSPVERPKGTVPWPKGTVPAGDSPLAATQNRWNLSRFTTDPRPRRGRAFACRFSRPGGDASRHATRSGCQVGGTEPWGSTRTWHNNKHWEQTCVVLRPSMT